jgi:hypothetical protein
MDITVFWGVTPCNLIHKPTNVWEEVGVSLTAILAHSSTLKMEPNYTALHSKKS